MTPLPLSDCRTLTAAEGWLELGDWNSAQAELEEIAPSFRAHPAVLKLQVGIQMAGQHWEDARTTANTLVELVPNDRDGWVHRSFALHELGRTQEAWDLLLPAATRFPDEWVIPYNLACYACRMGQLDVAREWLEKADDLGDPGQVEQMALNDPDLAGLRG